MVYLNSNLLENVNNYLYPLFYYCRNNSKLKRIYCPATLKLVDIDPFYNSITYLDYLNGTWRNSRRKWIYSKNFTHKYTEKYMYSDGISVGFLIKPFKISQENLNFLKNS